MTIDRNTLIFFDASCSIAAAGSPQGGSGFLLILCARGFLSGAVSQPVLLEAQRNIQAKLGGRSLNRFYNLLAVVPFVLASLPEESKIQQIGKILNSKDAHVLAAALAVNAIFLLTLDKTFILETNRSSFDINALSPGEFIRTVLPTHPEYHPPRD